ncbi:MAG: hypothetical protein ACT6WE_15285, partial [Shinella sp.]|uniref:hypothetical protein n=1 Tax=Shinella sp. TaxID=1870904 RepID=UPI004035B0BD
SDVGILAGRVLNNQVITHGARLEPNIPEALVDHRFLLTLEFAIPPFPAVSRTPGFVDNAGQGRQANEYGCDIHQVGGI